MSLMQSHPNDVVIAELGCGALAQIAMVGSGPAFAVAAGCGIHVVVISAMAALRHPAAALQACEPLVNVDCSTATIINFIVSILDSGHVSIVQVASKLGGKICVVRRAFQKVTVKGVHALSAVLQNHANDPNALRNGCAVLHILSNSYHKSCSAVSDCIGVDFTLAALHSHPHDWLVVEQTCGLLRCLMDGANVQSSWKAIVEANGVKVLIACLRCEIRKDDVVVAKVVQLCEILISIADFVEFRNALVEAGGVDVLLALLASKHSNLELFRLSCILVERMAFHRDSHLALCMGGAIGHILSIIDHNQPYSAMMAKNACSALKCLSASKDINLAVIGAGGFDIILSALRTVAPFGFLDPPTADEDDVQIYCVLHLMNTCPDSVLVARCGCNALLHLLKRSNFSTSMKPKGLLASSHIKHISEAMWFVIRSHYKDKNCLAAACESLVTLASVSKYCNIVDKAWQSSRGSVLWVIQYYKHIPRIVQPGCALLRYVLLNDGDVAGNLLIRSFHIAERVVEILDEQLSQVIIVEHCSAILDDLAAKAPDQDLGRISGTVFPSILLILRNYCTNEAVVWWGCSALHRLANRKQYLEIFGSENNLQILLDALLAHENNDLICDKLWGIIQHFARMDPASRPTGRNVWQLSQIGTRGNACIAGNACVILCCITSHRFAGDAALNSRVIGQLLILMPLQLKLLGMLVA